MRIGIGYDTHILVEKRNLILGGIIIPYDKGFVAHSDGDVLIHAIIDSILGAGKLGDIGRHFPDSNPKYKGISSLTLLQNIFDTIKDKYRIVNIDSTILCQEPKLSKFIPEMEYNLIEILKAPVSVKATTTEKMNDEGKGFCISAQAICLLRSF